MKVERALISVSDKKGVVELGNDLNVLGIEIISTGGTAKALSEAGIKVTSISDVTGFPEIMDGRVKTLHPNVHGGILAVRSNDEHMETLKKHSISKIDLVVVNLYPFEKTVANPDVKVEDAIENIDIGGPSMLRSAAKNNESVGVVVDPDDYEKVVKELKSNHCSLKDETRLYLAKKAFIHTAKYDSAIATYMSSIGSQEESAFPGCYFLSGEKALDLRYGENPHQAAAFYLDGTDTGVANVSTAKQLHGKELSFNNIIDIDAALQVAREFDLPAAAVIKHTNPCGAATSEDSLVQAYVKARATDPVSAFGGVIGLNRKVDAETAKEIKSTFIEAVIAPGYDDEALEILTSKKNLRLLDVGDMALEPSSEGHDIKRVSGGFLVQSRDLKVVDVRKAKVATKRSPTEKEYEALAFGWKVVKHVKSNAIVYANEDQLVGVGAGQMSRVDSSKLAVMKAELPIKGTALASDAFFPFRDAVDAAAEAGVTAVIQPGGSIRDEEVIAAADEHNLAMVFTGIRHFKH